MTVVLKDGLEATGLLEAQEETAYILRVNLGQLRIPKDQVARIIEMVGADKVQDIVATRGAPEVAARIGHGIGGVEQGAALGLGQGIDQVHALTVGPRCRNGRGRRQQKGGAKRGDNAEGTGHGQIRSRVTQVRWHLGVCFPSRAASFVKAWEKTAREMQPSLGRGC